MWLHSSVGRASHRYRGGHGFESRLSPEFFRLLYSNCLNWKFTAKITYHLHIYPQFIYESFHIHYIISLLSWENMNSQLTSLPMCGFIAQLVEHRTVIEEVTGSNPVEALIFSGFFIPIAYIGNSLRRSHSTFLK